MVYSDFIYINERKTSPIKNEISWQLKAPVKMVLDYLSI